MTDERPFPKALEDFRTMTLEQFAILPPAEIDDAQKERHRLYSLLVCALVYDKWNGNRYGEVGDYGEWRAGQILGTSASGENIYRGGSYLGHNIAAVAVDGDGRIMDFDFNHNDVFDSTVEHAESRLVRRVFALTQVYDSYAAPTHRGAPSNVVGFSADAMSGSRRRTLFAAAAEGEPVQVGSGFAAGPESGAESRPPIPYGTLLSDVTIYTSLESCAQCSGIMCLASVKEVAYLQWDQGQYLIGNMMWRATRDKKDTNYGAPRPIRGDEFDFGYFTKLNAAFEEFRAKIESGTPFFNGRTERRAAITSFLCTDAALEIFGEAAGELDFLGGGALRQPDWRPAQRPTALTNLQVLAEVKDFRDWARRFQKANALGSRGAPHRV